MVTKFGLSILIPTYNRPEILRNLVQKVVIPVAYKFEFEVEIFIRDNTGIKNIKNPLNKDLRLPDNVDYLVNEKNLEYHGNVNTLLRLATRKYIWFWGDDDYYDLKQVLKVIEFVLSKNQKYDGFLPCFSYLSDKSFNSNKVLGKGLNSINLNNLFEKNKSPFALLSSCIFINKKVKLNPSELSNAWLHAIIFLKSFSPSSKLWISHKPCIFYEAVSGEGSALEQRGITLNYYVDSALELIKCQENYAGVCPPTKVAFHKEVILWMVQHKARLIYWSFTEKDMFNYGIKGLLMFLKSFDFKLLFFSLILIFLPKRFIRLLYRIRRWSKRKVYKYQRFFSTISI